jgi:hypothetical protein
VSDLDRAKAILDHPLVREAVDDLSVCRGFGLPVLPQTPAGRLELALALAAPPCVDDEGNEYTDEPMIDAAGFLAILSGGEEPA